MIYHERLIERKVTKYFESFPCVLLSGPRQVGKSTLLRHLFGERCKTFVFDSVQDLYGARADPDLFIRNNPPPLILDEIQYAPELVPTLKRYVDEHRVPGQFLITGSQQWAVMKHLSESLAGRVAILELGGFSMSERCQDPGQCWFGDWVEKASRDSREAMEWLLRASGTGQSPSQLIWRGAFPEVQTLADDVIPGWMRGYVSTYLQRDVRSLLAVKDETQFASFLTLCSALTAQECNYSQLGRDIGLSTPTAQNWISALRGTFQWLENQAVSNNQIKKLSQKPKGYMTDTGLACYLLRLGSPEALQGHPSFGALFETFVVVELIRQVQPLPTVPAFYHFRQHSGAEVDVVVEINGRLFPVEIKASSSVGARDAVSIRAFQDKNGQRAGPGLVIYAGERVLRLGENCLAVPFDARV
jgi:predicted AAA+ superfamily ATPase